MLLCVCSVIDHRWRQNGVRKKEWHKRCSRVCHWCSYHILTSSVIYYWIFKIFQHNAKAGLCPTFAPPLPRLCTKKGHLTWSKMKQFHWLLCVAKNCDWSRKIAPLSNLTRASLLVEWKLTAKAELNCESTNLKENPGKSSQFLSSKQPCEPKSLDVALKITGVEEIPSENLWLRST